MTGMMMSTRRRSVAPSIVPYLLNASYEDFVSSIGPCNSSITFGNNGSLTWVGTSAGTQSQLGQFLTSLDSVQAALYELQCVIISGPAFNQSGTTAAGAGIWRDLSSPRLYGHTQNLIGARSTTATYTIRRKSDLAVIVAADITISAEVI